MPITGRTAAYSHARLLLDTLRLVPDCDTSELRARWDAADESALIQQARREGAELWLQRRLKELGVVLAGPARDDLAGACRRLIARVGLVDAELENVLAISDQVGVQVIPLKSGALRRIADRVPYVDARSAVDVDILVDRMPAQRLWDAFNAHGYHAPPVEGPPDGHHLPVLVGPTGVGVEIHISTIGFVPPAEAWDRVTRDGAAVEWAGRARRIPGDTELFWHSMAHALENQGGPGLSAARLRHWLDAAALLAAGVSIDWDRIHRRINAQEAGSIVRSYAWLGAAVSLSGRPLARGFLDWGAGGKAAFNLERLLSWRLRVAAYRRSSRWTEKLLIEAARAESQLAPVPSDPVSPMFVRCRHAAGSYAARAWWRALR